MNWIERARWRGGLAIGKALRAIGYRFSDLGWRIENDAALFSSRRADIAVAEIMAMSDEEILAVVPPDEIERTRQLFEQVAKNTRTPGPTGT